MITEMGILVVGLAISDNLSTICRPCPGLSTGAYPGISSLLYCPRISLYSSFQSGCPCLTASDDFLEHNRIKYWMFWGNSRGLILTFCLLSDLDNSFLTLWLNQLIIKWKGRLSQGNGYLDLWSFLTHWYCWGNFSILRNIHKKRPECLLLCNYMISMVFLVIEYPNGKKT